MAKPAEPFSTQFTRGSNRRAARFADHWLSGAAGLESAAMTCGLAW
jgi:hypothetical protein